MQSYSWIEKNFGDKQSNKPSDEMTVNQPLSCDSPILLPARHVYQPDWFTDTLCRRSKSGFTVMSSPAYTQNDIRHVTQHSILALFGVYSLSRPSV